MKSNINPAVGVVVIVLVVLVVGYFLYHASTDKPAYPGLNARDPSGQVAGGNQQQQDRPTNGPLTYQQASHMHISGMIPGAQPNAPRPPQSRPPGQ